MSTARAASNLNHGLPVWPEASAPRLPGMDSAGNGLFFLPTGLADVEDENIVLSGRGQPEGGGRRVGWLVLTGGRSTAMGV